MMTLTFKVIGNFFCMPSCAIHYNDGVTSFLRDCQYLF
ncbi:unknow [Vibrio parahaemolyticus]|nr:unknow [Vibrio parahaemolyticus]